MIGYETLSGQASQAPAAYLCRWGSPAHRSGEPASDSTSGLWSVSLGALTLTELYSSQNCKEGGCLVDGHQTPYLKELKKDLFKNFGHATQLMGSQFPDQGLNLGHNSKSAESYPLDREIGTESLKLRKALLFY